MYCQTVIDNTCASIGICINDSGCLNSSCVNAQDCFCDPFYVRFVTCSNLAERVCCTVSPGSLTEVIIIAAP
jgi:hypothetical protein